MPRYPVAGRKHVKRVSYKKKSNARYTGRTATSRASKYSKSRKTHKAGAKRYKKTYRGKHSIIPSVFKNTQPFEYKFMGAGVLLPADLAATYSTCIYNTVTKDYATATTNGLYSIGTSLLNQIITGGSTANTDIIASGNLSIPAMARMYLERYIQRVSLTNNTNMPARLLLHWFKPRRDLSGSCTANYSGAGSFSPTPSAVSQEGFKEMSQVTTTFNAVAGNLRYDEYIGDSDLFRQFYSVMKRRKVTLAPGKTRTFVCASPPGEFSMNMDANINNLSQVHKFTRWFTVKVQGFPDHLTSSPTLVGFTLPQIDVITAIEAKARYAIKVPPNQNLNYNATNMVTTANAVANYTVFQAPIAQSGVE